MDRRRFSFARPAFVTRPTTSRSATVWRAARMVVGWNTKSEPLSIRVTLPASNGPRIRSKVGTEVVSAGHGIARSSGATETVAGSATRAMKSSPRFDDDGGIKSEAEGRGGRKCPGTYRHGVTP